MRLAFGLKGRLASQKSAMFAIVLKDLLSSHRPLGIGRGILLRMRRLRML